uniref:Uncharacterized protein n=1 Tax=Rhizophora mucronata TaxID=61149 RepID=A0A2P2KM17_RHIMU
MILAFSIFITCNCRIAHVVCPLHSLLWRCY